MRLYFSSALLVSLLFFATISLAQRATPSPTKTGDRILGPADFAIQAEVVVIGKVVDVDKVTVDATRYRGAPKDQKTTYKIATVKIEEPLIGGRGLTQYRVGFPSEDQSSGFRPLPVGGPAPTVDQEACYFLSAHHEGNFYILDSAPLLKKDGKYAKQLEEVKKVARRLDDPVAALKAKDLEDRFQSALTILRRYQTNRSNRPLTREPIPADENKLILELLAELPWRPKDTKPRPATDPVAPCRSVLWDLIRAHESGYRDPPRKAEEPQPDYNKLYDEATAKFLKENMDKIKIKRYVK